MPSHTTFSLPFELVLYILETLAKDCQQARLDLGLISRSVRDSIEPVLYRNICLNTKPKISNFALTITLGYKPAQFYHTAVKSLCISSVGADPEVLETILSACTGLRSLACSDWHLKLSPKLAESLLSGKYPLRRLSVWAMALGMPLQGFTWTDLTASLFTCLTHLEFGLREPVEDSDVDLYYDVIKALQISGQLASLTHLAFNVMLPPDFSFSYTSLPAQLHVCVITDCAFRPRFAQLSPHPSLDRDPRIVFARYSTRRHATHSIIDRGNPVLDWILDWYGGGPAERADLWELAERIADRQMKYYLEAQGKFK